MAAHYDVAPPAATGAWLPCETVRRERWRAHLQHVRNSANRPALGSRQQMAEQGLITYRGAIYAHHCDHIGHMNVASYGAKFDEATWVLFCAIGATPSYLRGDLYGMAGVQQNLTYKRELFAGDVIEIRTHVLEVADKRIRFRHDMHNIETGDLAASSEITAVHLEKKAHKSAPFPQAIRDRAAALQTAGGSKS
jgi:acyl-CoA thioester hydrolase